MNRILILIEHRENRRLLSDCLSSRYTVIEPDWSENSIKASLLSERFDLCIICGRTLNRLSQAVQNRRAAEQPILLPFLLTTNRQDVGYMTRQVWQSVDELITQPIEKIELQARVEILLRSRQLSLRLQACESLTARQIAARHQAEANRDRALSAQRYSDEQFRQMAEIIPSVFWLFEIETNQPIYISPAYDTIWGRSREALYANFGDWIETVHPDDRAQMLTAPDRCLANGSSDEKYRIVRPDGSVRWIRDRGFVIFDDDGRPTRLAGVAEDVTDRVQIELERLRVADERESLLMREQTAREQAETANRIKDEFLAVLSHELRTPMNPILGWAKLLQQGNLDAARASQAIATIERNAKLQVQLIDDLLDISRILRGKLTLNSLPVSLTSVVSAAIDTVRLAVEAKAINLNVNLSPDVGQVLGDATRLQQVVWNLLTNAVKFTPAGGQITVELIQQQNQAQIQIIDTGKGIHSDFLPYVFEHFRQQDGATTRKFGGLGLGLAIVRQIVELHGGTVGVNSSGEGQGATFTVCIPLAPQLNDTIEPIHFLQSNSDLSGVQILVVDDDADSRDFIAFALEEAGAIVQVAATGVEALQLFTQSPPDLLISDIGMPEMDGYMLMRHIRELTAQQGKNVPAIALTAYAGEADEQRSKLVGFQKHIPKPIDPATGIAEIADLIRTSKR